MISLFVADFAPKVLKLVLNSLFLIDQLRQLKFFLFVLLDKLIQRQFSLIVLLNIPLSLILMCLV